MEGNTPKQAAVLPILSKIQVGQLLQLCSKVNVDCGLQILKHYLLAQFMRNHDSDDGRRVPRSPICQKIGSGGKLFPTLIPRAAMNSQEPYRLDYALLF